MSDNNNDDQTTNNEVDYYSMSDEEFMQQTPPDVPESSDEDEDRDHIEGKATNDGDHFDVDLNSDSSDSDSEDNKDDETTDTDDDNSDDSTETDESNDSNEDSANDDNSDENKDDTKNNKEGTESESDKILNEVFAPFKANGVEMQVKTAEEARRLMQQGANYNKKMQTLKPNLKFIKKLGNNELLDENKLDYLIDLAKGDPAAISKLLKEHNIDPLTVDTDKANDYKPNAYTVTDADVDLDETLSDLQGTSSYAATLDVVNNKWDEASRRIIKEQPENLRIINDHIEIGAYEVINAEVQKQRALGNISSSVSAIDAYQRVGEQLMKAGELSKFFKQESSNQSNQNNSRSQKNDIREDANVAKKKAAKAPANKSKGRGKPNEQSKGKKEIWEMSDSEFEEAMNKGSLF